MIATPPSRELVLVGGGHAHLGVLRAFARRPPPAGTRITLVAREAAATYSGMLPGLIAGRFAPEDCAVDLMRLARATGARFIQAKVTGLDRAAGLVLAAGRPPLHYDLLSLNCGAAPALVPGAAEHALPLRPFGRFLPGWHALLERAAAAPRPLELLVVGAGAAGVEVALALRRRLGAAARVGLVGRGAEPLPHHAPAARRATLRALSDQGVALHPGAAVARVEPGVLVRADGERLGFDAVIWATGAAPPGWLAGSGLDLCPRGFVAVDAALRSIGDARVFAAGDVASVLPHPRERAGVFAVRQGPPLAGNLRRALAGEAPRRFTPQHRYLALIATGTAAVATRGRLAASGTWALLLKDRIDRRWITMHARMPAMPPAPPGAEAPMRCGGCGAKLPAAVLARVLARCGGGGGRGGRAPGGGGRRHSGWRRRMTPRCSRRPRPAMCRCRASISSAPWWTTPGCSAASPRTTRWATSRRWAAPRAPPSPSPACRQCPRRRRRPSCLPCCSAASRCWRRPGRSWSAATARSWPSRCSASPSPARCCRPARCAAPACGQAMRWC
jgi:selenide,water dikinase